MTPLSATIITLNEERNIARAIKSLSFCNEVVVIDSGSTDATCSIAESLGARVIVAGWRGYAGQKNYAAECAAHDWILSLDADEEVSPELAAEIAKTMGDGPGFDGYTFPRLAQYLGRWIGHSGWYPDRKVRLYHRERAQWTGEYVHESVRVTGRTGELNGNLLHFTCQTLAEHVRTMDRYTSLAAKELVARGAAVPGRRMLVDPAWTFLRTYFIQQGFRDGPQGLTIAWMAAFYTFLKYAKARESKGF